MSNFNVPERLQPLFNSVKESTTIEDGVIRIGDDSFERNMPAHLTPQTFQDVEQYRSDFMSITELVGGELAIQSFEADPDLQLISGGVSIGGNTNAVFTSTRQTEVNGEAVFGSPRWVVNHKLPDTDAFSLDVRNHLHRLGAEALQDS